MVNFGVPYAMDGTTIPGVDLRQDSQRKIGVGSGVADSGDLKITALSTPGAGFRVAAGGVVVQCRAAGRTRETYSLSNHSLQNYMGDGGAGVPGPASGQTRSDMVILEVLDSTFAKSFTPKSEWPQDQWAKISVVQGVPATATRVDQVPALANVTAYALARIDWTAGATSITNAMIKDVRELHSPKSKRVLRIQKGGKQTGGEWDEAGNVFTPDYERFPQHEWTVDIPDFATQVQLSADWENLLYKAPAGTDGKYDARGRIFVGFIHASGNVYSEKSEYNFNPQGVNNGYRCSTGLWAQFPIPAALRGQTVILRMYVEGLTQSNGANLLGRLVADAYAKFAVDMEFQQVAAPGATL